MRCGSLRPVSLRRQRVINVIRIGTRGSALAQRQTAMVANLLRAVWPGLTISVQIITTQGDRVTDVPLPAIAGEGVFTGGLETALLAGEIDAAVHSLKDLPVEPAAGLVIAAVPERANPADALISQGGYKLAALPQGARVGTSSRRRAAQLRRLRPDLEPVDIRGNVDTRIAKVMVENGGYDAILLACAGLERLGRLDEASEILTLDDMTPAPGQGALAVQCRDEVDWRNLFLPINHVPTQTAVAAERAFLAGLGGGCALPVAAYGHIDGSELRLMGRVTAADSSSDIHLKHTYRLESITLESGLRAGSDLAARAKSLGAAQLLERG